jgi:5-methylcytosine-specific restriction endonuclease McrA
MPYNWKWNKEEYHSNYARRSLSRKKKVKYTCENCGAKQGENRISEQGRPYKIVVAAAHVNHDPWNARAELVILCQVCHLRHDALEHGKKMRSTKYKQKRQKQIENGQLELPLLFRRTPKRKSQ